MELAGTRVVVLGLGRSGRAAASLAASAGASVVVLDDREDLAVPEGLDVRLGPHDPSVVAEAEVMVVSPGVAAAHPSVVSARAAGARVVGELGFAAGFLDGVPLIAITGTNGKSTVTTFTGHLAAADGRRVFVGGNLGTPLSEAVRTGPWDLLVVEVSSYQLELPGSLTPTVAAVLNLTEDHLARHGTMEVYGATKCRLLERLVPGGPGFLPVDDPFLRGLAEGLGQGSRRWIGGLPGVSRQGDRAVVSDGTHRHVLDLSEVDLTGGHNLDHAATAAALALAAGVRVEAVQQALPSLQALPHRMQPVGEWDGVLWIDDSKATNLEATSVALRGLERPAVVLLGGQAKGGGFARLAPDLIRHRGVITFGGSGEAIADELEQVGVVPHRADTLAAAVEHARTLALPGEAVLLSPGCASFDAFDDFAHRGRVFARLAQGGSP